LPFPYSVSAFWGGQEGSLLLWLLVLTGLGSLALTLNRDLIRSLLPWTVPVLGGVATFFAFLLVFVSSPFERQAAPLDGSGLVPSLQNPYMMIHPPLLYLGYVGLTIPFAFAAGALLSGRVDERWIVATRRWTLLAWTALGIGILLGAKWAYEEVGWGGYYAWDPVENAALMPWLASTAFLHSVMVQEKKNMLRVWNVVLVSLAFCLSLFGTFLTRSGVISSIHSFTQSSIGPWLLGFIAVVAAFSTALIFWRLPLLRTKTRLESLASREAAFLYNNLLLVAFTLTVLWGVAFPLLLGARARREDHRRPSVLRLLPARLGVAIAAVDGDRAARGMAPELVTGSRREPDLAVGLRARVRCRPRRARRRLEPARARGLHVLRVRARGDRAGVRARHQGAEGTRRRDLARRVLVTDRPQPAPLRRLRRPRGDRPARAGRGRGARTARRRCKSSSPARR
jgi:cytochrome c-type biogenesis protein CcmF